MKNSAVNEVWVPLNPGSQPATLTNQEVPSRTSRCVFLYICAITIHLPFFAFGCNLVWTSPVIPKLKSENMDENPLGAPATASQISIIAGIPFVGSILGSLLLGQTCDIIGRRKIVVIIAFVNFVSYLILAFTNLVYCYYLSRFLLGACQGIGHIVFPIYLSEIADKNNRGRVGCRMALLVVAGSLYGFIIGPLFSVRTFTLTCSIPMILCVIMMIFVVPESPYFLVSKGRNMEALSALRKFTSNVDISDKYKDIQDTFKYKTEDKHNVFVTLIKDPVNRRASAIVILIAFFQYMSGSTVIMAFVGPLFNSSNGGLSGDVVALIVGVVKFISFFLTSTVIEIVGRKKLLSMSFLGSGIVHACLGFYFFARAREYSFATNVSWLPVVLVVSYIIFYAFGVGPIPILLSSELLPPETKSLATSIVTCVSNITAFVLTSGFSFMVDSLGQSTCFWIFSVGCFAGAIYVLLFLVETKGKTLLEIQEMLRSTV